LLHAGAATAVNERETFASSAIPADDRHEEDRMDPQCIADLYVALARQSVKDYESGYTNRRHMEAGEWLMLAGLLTGEGQIDTRGITQRNRSEENEVARTPDGEEQEKPKKT
jgi:hypothetical protein